MSTAWDEARREVAGDELLRSGDWLPGAGEARTLEKLRDAIDAFLTAREQWRLAAARHEENQGYTAEDVTTDEEIYRMARRDVFDLIEGATDHDRKEDV